MFFTQVFLCFFLSPQPHCNTSSYFLLEVLLLSHFLPKGYVLLNKEQHLLINSCYAGLYFSGVCALSESDFSYFSELKPLFKYACWDWVDALQRQILLRILPLTYWACPVQTFVDFVLWCARIVVDTTQAQDGHFNQVLSLVFLNEFYVSLVKV